eukprot:scaffold10899_cov70-Phaeocystis_antarctica.AAC.7
MRTVLIAFPGRSRHARTCSRYCAARVTAICGKMRHKAAAPATELKVRIPRGEQRERVAREQRHEQRRVAPGTLRHERVARCARLCAAAAVCYHRRSRWQLPHVLQRLVRGPNLRIATEQLEQQRRAGPRVRVHYDRRKARARRHAAHASHGMHEKRRAP